MIVRNNVQFVAQKENKRSLFSRRRLAFFFHLLCAFRFGVFVRAGSVCIFTGIGCLAGISSAGGSRRVITCTTRCAGISCRTARATEMCLSARGTRTNAWCVIVGIAGYCCCRTGNDRLSLGLGKCRKQKSDKERQQQCCDKENPDKISF